MFVNQLCGKILVASLLIFTSGIIRAQSADLQGIVNAYTPVLAIADCKFISVADSEEFNAGDRVLLIQMQGAEINEEDNEDFGRIRAYNNAGNYEFATIAGFIDNTIELTSGLQREYTMSGAVQLLRVAHHKNANIIAEVTAPPWDGSVGGVVVIEVEETLSFWANIDVSGLGFRGGEVSAPRTNPNRRGYVYPLASGSGGQKGESIAAYLAEADAGRGAQGNGGGGGNDHNTGGGGGSNLSSGGQGGQQWSGFGRADLGGLPGWVLDSDRLGNRIFMGGGGGGGQQNERVGSPGTNGGGIVILRARVIEGLRRAVIANGIDQEQIAVQDGSGGGGAGGTVLVEAEKLESPLVIHIQGGDGGSSRFAPGCVGPGGGGGGGIVWVNDPDLPADLVINAAGGAAGLLTSNGSSCFNTSYGAMPGAEGSLRSGLIIPEGRPHPGISIEASSPVLCPDDTMLLRAPDGFERYEWSHGATGPVAEVSQAGTYRVKVWNRAGCVFESEPVQVGVLTRPETEISGDLTICRGETSLLDAGGPFANYEWSGGENSRTIEISEPGLYWVVVEDIHGCRSIADTVEVQLDPGRSIVEFVGVDNTLVLPDVSVGSVTCSNLRLRNSSDEETVIVYPRLRRNIEFSVPAHQFPLRLQAREEVILTVCFVPTATGVLEDVLRIESGCGAEILTLRAGGTVAHLTGTSACDVSLLLGSASTAGGALRVFSPYPQPARGRLTIPLYSTGAAGLPGITVVVRDLMGRSVAIEHFRSTVSHSSGGELPLHAHEIELDLSSLRPGLYLAELQSEHDRAVLPIVVAE